MDVKDARYQIGYWASLLNKRSFVTAKNGNISCRLDSKRILITAHDAYLGSLEEDEILTSDLDGNLLEGKLQLTSEKGLHTSIYKKLKDASVVMHAHPTYTTAFFHYFKKLEIYSFESQFYLGEVSVIDQDTPSVTDLEPVLKALEGNNIVVLKKHGVVSVGKDFKDAFALIELLDDQCKVGLITKALPAAKESPCRDSESDKKQDTSVFKMLSSAHGERLKSLVNSDKEAQKLGQKYDLTLTLAVKNQDTQESLCFYYEKGTIVKIDNKDDAEFVIIGQEDILKKVFNRQIDPFVALTQGKVKSKGDLSRMSKWYPVMVRTFKLWEQAPVK